LSSFEECVIATPNPLAFTLDEFRDVTLGPVGTVAHAFSVTTAKNVKTNHFQFILPCPPLGGRRGYIGYHLHPASRTALDVWVVALRILTVVPVVGLLLLRFAILGRFLDDLRRRLIRAVDIGIWIGPPPTGVGIDPRSPPITTGIVPVTPSAVPTAMMIRTVSVIVSVIMTP
jgi:hypothetical protein